MSVPFTSLQSFIHTPVLQTWQAHSHMFVYLPVWDSVSWSWLWDGTSDASISRAFTVPQLLPLQAKTQTIKYVWKQRKYNVSLKKYPSSGYFGWKPAFLKTSAHIDNIHCHNRSPEDLLPALYNLFPNVETCCPLIAIPDIKGRHRSPSTEGISNAP